MSELSHYADLLAEIKSRIQSAQARAVLAVNAELVRLYWHIGCLLKERQAQQGWGAGIIPKLARDLKNELPEVKGFGERSLNLMLAFARAYPEPGVILQQAAAKLAAGDSLLWRLPWGHHAVLPAKVKPLQTRIWYMAEVASQGWSRSVLQMQIESGAHARQQISRGKTGEPPGTLLEPIRVERTTKTIRMQIRKWGASA